MAPRGRMAIADPLTMWHRRIFRSHIPEPTGMNYRDLGRYIKGCFYTDVLEKGSAAHRWWFSTRDGRNFGRYATAFEKNYSTILRAGEALPIVSSRRDAEWWVGLRQVIATIPWDASIAEYDVVGHIGWFVGSQVQVPTGSSGSLKTIMSGKKPILIAQDSPPGYTNYASSEEAFQFVTDVYGQVVWFLGKGLVDAEMESTIDKLPISIAIGKALKHPIEEELVTLLIEILI